MKDTSDKLKELFDVDYFNGFTVTKLVHCCLVKHGEFLFIKLVLDLSTFSSGLLHVSFWHLPRGELEMSKVSHSLFFSKHFMLHELSLYLVT